ncbi:cell wall hydrolase [Paenibacillus sp. LHD-117]|uniref:cell wall hydrolase n=1 Tax=Paenibacillus sp. LHD-117 TaxID=3071412 RepID=UPI0027DEF97C|nr:cell wall hydrolase [Paenibacillus sp. LHD-117]MDQ6423220.1 cell wall hydrolase [Paenibacillus sp. LHD-117]
MIGTTKRKYKRWIHIVVAAMMLLALPMSASAAPWGAKAAQDTVIKLDGEAVKLSEPPIMLDGRLFVPVALVADLFKAKKIGWDKKNEETTIETALGDTIVLGDGVPVVYFNKARYVMDEAPFIEDGRMYVPLRHVAELLHAKVKWNKEEEAAELTTVQPAVVTEENGLGEIVKAFGTSQAELLVRNEMKTADGIKEGTSLRVVMPSIFDKPAKPYTEQDYTLLAKITMVEAGYESYEGQLAVANVILNRVKDARFPDSIRDVIYSGKQFPPAHNGLLDKAAPNASVLRAAKDALNGKNNVKGAVYFFNPKVSKGSFWSSLDVVAKIGHHHFAE